MVESQFSLRRPPRAQGSGPVYGGAAAVAGLQPGLVKGQPAARPSARYAGAARTASPAPRPVDQTTATAADSLATIERALENINSLQGSIGFYKEMVAELRACLDEERRHREDAHAQIGGLEQMVASERERALLADKRNAQADNTIAELRSQLAVNQTETMRLVTAIQTLTSVHLETSAKVVDYAALRAA